MKYSLVELDERLDELSYYQMKDPVSWQDFKKKFELCWIYHENYLDGMAISTEDITAALESDITTNISLVSSYRRVRNYRNAIELIYERTCEGKAQFDVELLRELHAILANGLDTNLGRFRRNSPVHRAYFQDICAPGKIEQHLQAVINLIEAEQEEATMHPLELAGKVQYMLMEAYPFSCWSGVVARFFTNMLLLNENYLPLVIHGHDRQRYYQAIATSSAAVTRVLTDSYENALDSAFLHFVEPRQMLAGA